MSASPYRHTCAQLGVCQDRLHRCTDCKPASERVRIVNCRRVHTIDQAPIAGRPLPHVPQPKRDVSPEHRLTGWFWFLFGAGATVLLSGLVLYAK